VPTPGLESSWSTCTARPRCATGAPTSRPATGARLSETAEAFDDEGFFCTGDAVKWIDEDNLHLGLKFDGRIAEDFKLATGTFVSVGPLRARSLRLGAPYIQDVVITGLNLHEVGAMVFPNVLACRDLAGLPPDAPVEQVLASPGVHARFQGMLDKLSESHWQRQPHFPSVPAGRAAHHRPRRDHRQGIHQPARRADPPRRLDGVRTPMVDYCGSLGHISPTDLGIKAARAVLARAGVPGEHIGTVITGNMAPGDYEQFMLPRHIGLYAGVPQEVPALMTQRICGTGFELFRQAGEQIESGCADVALVTAPSP
jgi:hypothetical protein